MRLKKNLLVNYKKLKKLELAYNQRFGHEEALQYQIEELKEQLDHLTIGKSVNLYDTEIENEKLKKELEGLNETFKNIAKLAEGHDWLDGLTESSDEAMGRYRYLFETLTQKQRNLDETKQKLIKLQTELTEKEQQLTQQQKNLEKKKKKRQNSNLK